MSALATLSLPWPFEYEYMQLALAAGLVVGATAPLIGVFLVQKRLSLMGDGIGHVAFAGVAVGFLVGVWPVWSALLIATAGALAIEWVRARGRAPGDLALALFLYGGLAAAVVIIGKANVGLAATAYLFGQILTVTSSDVLVVVGLGFGILVVLGIAGRALFAVVLDEESARVAGLPVAACNAMLAVLTAVTVVAAMRVVGVLLIAALMVLPVASARLLARSFRSTVVLSVSIGIVAVVGGLVAAREWALAPGGAIVLSAVLIFVVAASVPWIGQQTARTDG
jgi:zinc transport system permease protein